jgi:uncharacterized membrane protein
LAADATAQPSPTSAWQVYEIFHRSCSDCHGGHLAKPKGKMGYILDLPRLVEEGKITAGDADNSDLFAALISTDDEEKMPPPDSEGPKLSADDIEVIRAWINAGASIGEKTAAENTAPATAAPEVPATRPLGQKLGRLHPLLVHFPIALLLAAFVAESLSRLRPRHASSWQSMTRGSLWLAALGGIAAAICGWLNAAHEGYASGEVDIHRWLGVTTASLAVVTLAACEYAERARARDATRGGRGPLLGLLVIAVVVVTLAGHTGGVLAYGADYLGF